MKPTLPERTATPLELAREAARMLSCACGARPGYTCDGKGGMHLSRFADARRWSRSATSPTFKSFCPWCA